MDFSFWSRLHCNYLPESKGTRCSRSSGDGFAGSAWWQRRDTDYLFCFAFCFHARHLFGEQAVCHCRDDCNKGTSNPWALFCHSRSQPACWGPRNDISRRSLGQRHTFSFAPQTNQLPLQVLFLAFLLPGTWTFNCSLWSTAHIALIFLIQSLLSLLP